MLLRSLFFIAMVLVSGCATSPKTLNGKQAIRIAREAIDSREHWKYGEDLNANAYMIGGRNSGWIVDANEVVAPRNPYRKIEERTYEDAARYEGGRSVRVTIDMGGKIIYYGKE
jgi:hypothetical protein